MDKRKLDSKEKKCLLYSEAFNEYMLAVSINLVRLIIGVVGLFSVVLIVADYLSIDNETSRIAAVVLRSVFVVGIIVLCIWIKRIKTFRLLAVIISLYEIASALLFLYIFSLYQPPDFNIQLLGAIILVLIVFLVPNRWHFKLIISLFISIGFLVYAYLSMDNLNMLHFFTGSIYLFVEVVTCGGFALFLQRYQRGEFLSHQELMRVYTTDPLTKVGNRIKLQQEADQWIEFCSRHHLDLSLVIVDIDDMKTINDNHGHLVGDIVLTEAAQVMSRALRKNDVCVRWGGDEFVLLLPKTNTEQAQHLTKRIKDAFDRQEITENLRITCSFGITGMRKGDSLDLLVQQADASMYAAKKEGKNAIRTSQ